MHVDTHGAACPSTKSPIPWLATGGHQLYMILLLVSDRRNLTQTEKNIQFNDQTCSKHLNTEHVWYKIPL